MEEEETNTPTGGVGDRWMRTHCASCQAPLIWRPIDGEIQIKGAHAADCADYDPTGEEVR